MENLEMLNNSKNSNKRFTESEFKKIVEGGTSRIYHHLTDNSNTCAIISAYRSNKSENENKENTTKLKSIVRKQLGLGFVEFVSKWIEDGESSDEKALLIIGITFKQSMKLAKQFEQCSFIYKDENKCEEICSTPFEGYNEGDVVRTFNISGKNVLNIHDAEEIFSKRATGAVSVPIKSNGSHRPFHLKEVEPELDEVLEITQPRPSYFQTKYRYTKIL